MNLEEFFAGEEGSRQIFEALRAALAGIGPAEMAVSRSQIAFRRQKTFALAWIPGRYLKRKAAPLVLTLSFRRRDPSARWKEIVEPARGRFTHHLELYSTVEIDAEVKDWLRQAWLEAGA